LRLKRDDGAVVYLNGIEIARSAMPTNAPIDYSTLATLSADSLREKAFFPTDVSSQLSLLHAGQNVIAVEVHQATVDSDDLGFDLEFCANRLGTVEPPAVAMQGPPDGTTSLANRTVTITADALGVTTAIAGVRFFADRTELAFVRTPPYSYSWTNPPPGLYRLCAIAEDVNGNTAIQFSFLNVVTNLPPQVSLVAPGHQAIFREGEPFEMVATATDDGGQVRKVQFFVQNADLFGQPMVSVGTVTQLPYQVMVGDLTGGEYTAVAIAEDDAGANHRSDPVHFTILPPLCAPPAITEARIVPPDSLNLSFQSQNGFSY